MSCDYRGGECARERLRYLLLRAKTWADCAYRP